MTIKREHIPELRRRLNEHASSQLADEDLVPSLSIDMEIPPQAVIMKPAEDL